MKLAFTYGLRNKICAFGKIRNACASQKLSSDIHTINYCNQVMLMAPAGIES